MLIIILIGIIILLIFLRSAEYGLSGKKVFIIVLCGILGIIFWGGLLIGPIIAILIPIIPSRSLSTIPLKVVLNVELDKYTGRWYEISHLPNHFQKDCTDTIATYRLKDDGTIEVINECLKNGENYSVKGIAKVVNKKTPAILKVKFFGPFWGDYWIIELGKDYDYAVIGSPSRRYMWVICRNIKMDPELYNNILQRMNTRGFNIDNLVLTKHTGKRK